MIALLAGIVAAALGTLIYVAVQAHLDALDNSEWD
jgi:hypothetical protein